MTIKDSEWCGSLGSQGASCAHTLTDTTEQLTLQQWAVRWDNPDDPLVCTSVQTLADIKADVEQLCSDESVCTYDTTEQVNQLSAKLTKLTAAAKKARGN